VKTAWLWLAVAKLWCIKLCAVFFLKHPVAFTKYSVEHEMFGNFASIVINRHAASRHSPSTTAKSRMCAAKSTHFSLLRFIRRKVPNEIVVQGLRITWIGTFFAKLCAKTMFTFLPQWPWSLTLGSQNCSAS